MRGNTQGRLEFIFYQSWFVFVTWFCYKNTLFRCIGKLSYGTSMWLLIGIVLVICVGFSALEFRTQRNGISIAANIFCGFGLYAAITYFSIRTGAVLIPLIIAAVLTIAFSVLILGRKIKDKRNAGRIMARRLARTCVAARNLIGGGLSVVMLCLVFNLIFGTALFVSPSSVKDTAGPEIQTMYDNRETLLLLRDETWPDLSIDEKLRVLQTVADIERYDMGIWHKVTVGASNLNGDTSECITVANYKEAHHQICVDLDCLLNGSSYDLVCSVIHEVRHCYQYCLVYAYEQVDEELKSLQPFRNAAAYAKEFGNYESGSSDNYYDYYMQACETDARLYSEDVTYEYFKKIDEYALWEELDEPAE